LTLNESIHASILGTAAIGLQKNFNSPNYVEWEYIKQKMLLF